MQFLLPQNTIFYQLEKAIKVYRKLAQKQIHDSGYAISLNQMILLIQLIERPNSTQVELAELIFKDLASVTRMVDILVKKGHLKRSENPKDRRKKDLVPTTECKKMIAELIPVIKHYRQLSLNGFSQKNLNQLITLLQKLTTNCEEQTVT